MNEQLPDPMQEITAMCDRCSTSSMSRQRRSPSSFWADGHRPRLRPVW